MTENGLTAEPRICGQVVGYGLGDRYSNTYCDWLPSGHEGACEVRPLAGRMAEAWSAVSPQPPDDLGAMRYAITVCPLCHTGRCPGHLADEAVTRYGLRVNKLEDELADLRARIEALQTALADAIEGMEDMIGYVPEYFREKWDHQGDIDRARAVLAVPASVGVPDQEQEKRQ